MPKERGTIIVMKDNLAKLVFVLVVLAAVLFSRNTFPAPVAETSSAENSTTTQLGAATAPLFVMPTVHAVATPNDEATATADNAPIVTVAPGTTPLPQLQDEASLVADLSTGQVIESVNPDRRWPTASLTKLMTATIVEDDISSSSTITITEPEFAVDPTDEETLIVGDTYSVPDLLHVMLMPSSNVAAQAFADSYGETNFIAEMNARAAAWGMTNTYYDDPSGLSAANESTANDFLTLAKKIYASYPEILAITNTSQIYITEQNSGQKVLVKSINDFAGDPGFIGGKTGHTPQASGNLFSIFNDDGHPIFIVVLGTNDRFMDTQKLYAWYKANFK